MTATPDHESQFADLLDELLELVQNGEEPDLEAAAARHPTVADRIDEALTLAGNLAGRKVSVRPTLPGYEIVRELGRGGMGTVYLARQVELQREVALKVLPHSFGLSDASRQRFLEEARALAHVKHEHIVDIHRIVDDGEMLAFEMEFIEGPSLHTVLATMREHRENTGTLPSLTQICAAIGIPIADLSTRSLTQFFVRLFNKIARALAAVHAAGFVHRDVKPANVLLRQNGDPVVVDFGLVRLHGLEVTQAGRFAGTPVYSSPEQLRGDVAVGPTSDVYSLGVTLYECLTLATPFAGRTTTALLQRIEQGRFQPLRRLAPDAPRDLETIVAHAMEIDPLQRYANAGELADDLQRLLELRPIQARPVHPVRRVGKFLRRNRKPLLGACVGAVLVAAALFPVLHSVEAASRAQQAAAEYVQAARQHVITVDSGSVDWRHTVWGNPTRPRLQPAGEQSRPLRDARRQYEQALALVPDDLVVRRECDVVRLTIWLQQLTASQKDTVREALQGDEFGDITAHLGPATVRAAKMLAGERHDASMTDDEIDATTDTDRKTVGLLAYLFGDFRLCEQAWGSEHSHFEDHPLVNSGLGRLLLADGMLEPAYGRLLQAHRHFPESVTVTLELADAALRLGDLRLARQWLTELPEPTEGTALPRRKLELDFRAAAEVGADLIADYEQLAKDDPYDPTPRHRLAQLALRRGDMRAAEDHLETLVRGWPEAAEFRLDRARVALQRRDLPAYARQVLAVLDQDYGRERSRGTTANMLEILRIGGLETLYIDGIAATGRESAGRVLFGGEIAIQSFAPPLLTQNFGALVRLAHEVLQQVRQLRGQERRLDDYSAHVLLSLPLAINKLSNAAQLSVPGHLLVAFIPWIGPDAYDYCEPHMRHLLVNLNYRGWRLVQLTNVAMPADLPAAAVFGHALLSIDDCTGDGVEEVLLACALRDPSSGQARMLLVDGRSADVLATLTSDSRRHLFGHSMATVDDIDGDGSQDWIFGCPSGVRAMRRGRVEVWSGATRKLLHVLTGDEPGFGGSVVGLGDCNGDGCADFAVATVPLLRNSAAHGSVQVFSGRTYEVLATWHNEVPGVWFGACMANVGDADGDDVPDLLVGGNYGGAPGLARLYSCRTGAVLHTWTDRSSTSGFGHFVGGAGDIDGDGSSDVIVSAVDVNKTSVDQVFVYSGRTGAELAVLSGDRPGTGFGKVVQLYHVSPDPVLAIGVPSGGDPATGTIEILSIAGESISTITGPGLRGGFGWSLAVVGDSDGDGLSELFVSGPAPNHAGRVWQLPSRQWLRGGR